MRLSSNVMAEYFRYGGSNLFPNWLSKINHVGLAVFAIDANDVAITDYYLDDSSSWLPIEANDVPII
jgi:hypothetical protein